MRTRRHLAALAAFGSLVLVASLASSAPKKKGGGSDGQDTVILNDGTVLKGWVTSEDPKKGVTIKLAGGKTRKIPAADVKLVDRSMPAEEKDTGDEPPPKKEAPPKKEEPAEDEETAKKDEKEPASPAGEWKHEGVHFGGGVDLAAVLSKENAAGSLKVISPWLGVHGAMDAAIASGFYFRGELSIGTFTRKASITVPLTVDTTGLAPVVTPQVIHNDVRVIDFGLRALVGYDYTEMLTGRLGLSAGLTTASTSAVQCANDDHAKSGLSYGGKIVPIAARFLPSKALEVGVAVQYLSVFLPRCDVPNVNGFVAPAGAITTFVPTITTQRIGVGTGGLEATWIFW